MILIDGVWRPLCVELFAGCMTWSAGWLKLGGVAIGFDIEHLPHHGPVPENALLVLQDVLTLHGAQFRDADLILASPPCQKYSYLAMPWSRSTTNNSQGAKALRREWETNGPDNRLFDACFRIQAEASEAAGRYIPMIVENVRGSQEWVTRKPAWNYGSFYLYGDVPALMPSHKQIKGLGGGWFHEERGDPRDVRRQSNGEYVVNGLKRPGRALSQGFNNWPKDERGAYVMPDGTTVSPLAQKSLIAISETIASGDGMKQGGDWFSTPGSISRTSGGRSAARKAAAAMIARIPFPLSLHIAKTYYPEVRS